jgi:hypothetical protein
MPKTAKSNQIEKKTIIKARSFLSCNLAHFLQKISFPQRPQPFTFQKPVVLATSLPSGIFL